MRTNCQNSPHSSRPLNDRGFCSLYPEIDDEGLLFTNDPELAGLWFMVFHDTYKDIEASFTADELIKLMQEKTGSTSEDMYELMEEMKEIDDDFSCHQFEFIPIEDCE